MLVTNPDARWMGGELADHLLAFAWLPSRTLHVSRQQALMPEAGDVLLKQFMVNTPAWSRLHRHWSAALTKLHRLPEMMPIPNEGLALAMLPPMIWDKVQALGGVTLAGPRIRRCIVRDQVKMLKEQLGDLSYGFAVGFAAHLYAGWDHSMTIAPEYIAPTTLRWGQALQARALQATPPAVAQRGFLRLPEDALQDANGPLFADMEPTQALQLTLLIIKRTDPQWLSLFPSIP